MVTSSDSKLYDIEYEITLGFTQKPKIEKELSELKKLLDSFDYRDFQVKIWCPIAQCDWKLWEPSLKYFQNYIKNLEAVKSSTAKDKVELSLLRNSIWEIKSKINEKLLSNKEKKYSSKHCDLSEKDYNILFSDVEKIQQWESYDCYLVSAINELARCKYFKTLIKTSMTKEDWGYTIKIPLGEPGWLTFRINNDEINKVASIQWNPWFKILELAYAKKRLHIDWEITKAEFQKIWWWTIDEALQTFLGKYNIWFCDFWTYESCKDKWEPLNIASDQVKGEIKNFLKNYNTWIGNRYAWVSSLPMMNKDQWRIYYIWWKCLFRWHAYSITWVSKDKYWNIEHITVLNPWNDKGEWENYQKFTFDEFLQAFSYITVWKINMKHFLNEGFDYRYFTDEVFSRLDNQLKGKQTKSHNV